MEHIIVSNLMKHLEIQNILFPLQHGFRRNHSCESQLLSLFQDLASSTTQTDMLIMDFSKAFDKVPHKRLNYKLNWYGIRGGSLTCQHIHIIELCGSFKFWLLWQRNKCTENPIDQLLLYYLFWTCMSEIKSRPYFSFTW